MGERLVEELRRNYIPTLLVRVRVSNRPQIEVDDLGVPVLLLHGALVPHGKVDSLLLARPLKQPVENVARL